MAHKGCQYFCDWPDCVQGFTSKANLTKHINAIHKKLQPYTCSHPGCDFRSSYKMNVKVHEETHLPQELRDKPFKCDWPECDFSTYKKDSLKGHIRSHKNERPYACSHPGCDFRATQRSAIRGHIETHSTELNQVCDCGKRFKTKGSLWQHINVVHKGYRNKKRL